MAKIKNKTIWSEDREKLQFLADELEFIGRPYKLNLKEGYLIQFALPPGRTKRRKGKKGKKDARNKRAESAARNS